MSVKEILDDIRRDVAAKDTDLKIARERLAAVLCSADGFSGSLRTFRSGSLATRFTNDPVDDGDGGLVIDRRSRPSLGPDGDGELPADLISEVHDYIRPLLAEEYPGVRVHEMKRGLLLIFDTENSPTVDLVIALNRKDEPGLWIPNTETQRWDPSDPERHVELFTAGDDSLRQCRAHVVRLAKSQVKQFSKPHRAVCSFNIAALAWECITEPGPIDLALHRFYDYAANELDKGLTADPAGVSEPIKVPDLERAVKRFRKVADALEAATEAKNDDERVEILSAPGVFWKLLDSPNKGSNAASLTSALSSGRSLAVGRSGAVTASAGSGVVALKSTRAYGDA